MPDEETIRRARAKKQQSKAPSTQAGEFVREEMEHLKQGKHGATSPKQAVAIGLSKARRAGVDLPPPKQGQAKEKTRRSAEAARRKGQQQGELKGAAGPTTGRRRAPAAAETRPAERRATEKRAGAKKAAAKKRAARKAAARGNKPAPNKGAGRRTPSRKQR